MTHPSLLHCLGVAGADLGVLVLTGTVFCVLVKGLMWLSDWIDANVSDEIMSAIVLVVVGGTLWILLAMLCYRGGLE